MVKIKTYNKRMLSDWFSAALQTSRKCGRYDKFGIIVIILDIKPEDTLALRNEILRPGKHLSACVFEGDDDSYTKHFGAIDSNDTIVGIVSVYRNINPQFANVDSYQLRGMATKSSCRGLGIGNLLLASAESCAKTSGAKVIWANARSSAIGFYIKHGYNVVSDEFFIDGIGPHFVVMKSLV